MPCLHPGMSPWGVSDHLHHGMSGAVPLPVPFLLSCSADVHLSSRIARQKVITVAAAHREDG